MGLDTSWYLFSTSCPFLFYSKNTHKITAVKTTYINKISLKKKHRKWKTCVGIGKELKQMREANIIPAPDTQK